ncbi:MAG TPA: c-type cytochrome [Candidatus Dormibacteraeota bacterium]|nr:c-type cytochrome [Candidatus Dormibacteraeota bacterium]
MPESQSDDPILTRSFAVAILVSSFLLVLVLAWALYDEMFGLRPWRSYQRRFVTAYQSFLNKQVPQQQATLDAVVNSTEYKRLQAAGQAAMAVAQPRVTQIDNETRFINLQLSDITESFTTARGKVQARTYQLELAKEGTAARKSRLEDVENARKEKYDIALHQRDGKIVKSKMDFAELERLFNDLKAQKARLTGERVAVLKEASDIQTQLEEYKKEHMTGLTPDQLKSLVSASKNLDVEIRQINVNPTNPGLNNTGSGGLVDRCQSCHLAMDTSIVPPNLTLTKADLAMAKSHDAPFTTHPDMELLKVHNVEKYGCSPCHGGNGRAVSSVEKAHGRYEHWLWPLYEPANYEAGCQTCHAADMITEHAPVLNRGKDLYRSRGCIGCHKFEGFDDQTEQLQSARQLIKQLEQQKKEDELLIPRLNKQADAAADNETAQRLNAQATALTVSMSSIDARVEQVDRKSESLFREEKRVGPDLKEIRMKLRKEWIPYWIANTHTFRPTTKMPQFRLRPDEVQALAAFVWQAALTGPQLPKQAPGNGAHGKVLLETRGCLACHSVGEDSSMMGGTFAANLSRVGEKDNFDYLVRWVHNARERTRPYCPFEKNDLGPEDYAKHGLPFVFDLEHSRCPNDGHQLQVQQPTVMPSLRLTVDEARDIASYLITLKHADASYLPAPYMDDPQLFDKGKALVRNYGCAGCHEISGLEDEGRIGAELTTEGSKPIDRFDFGRLTEVAKRGVQIQPNGTPTNKEGNDWYDQKGFFEAKLRNPGVFDYNRAEPQLKMPKPNATNADITALTTFLLGSVDQQFPPEYMYKPGDQRRDIQEGLWIISKYNCMGCHQVRIGQESVLQNLPMYQGENKANLPPALTTEGARVDPNWLQRFLANPALSTTDIHRNGVRSYLQLRMPTFMFSDDEIQKLVKFFAAASSQVQPYIPPSPDPLTAPEKTMARELFTSSGAPCLKCHATGNPAHDQNASAPNFLLARDRLKPAWTLRWITDPAKIIPGTSMPSGLFRREGDRWVFSGPLPASFHGYSRDHADLLVRYMFQLTPEEQRSLLGRTSPATGGGGRGSHK